MGDLATVEVDGRQYVIPSELARRHGVTVHAIRIAITRGQLEAVQMVGRWLIPLSAAEEWSPKPKGGPRPGSGRPKKAVAS
jgi:hypothetical protein